MKYITFELKLLAFPIIKVMIYNKNNFEKDPVDYVKNSNYKFTSNYYIEKKGSKKSTSNTDLLKKIPKLNVKGSKMYNNLLTQTNNMD